ncbi:MAG TPA: hypothetical protein VKU41_32820 [Polyangiaceae bacterium]|nr:hypothetical protein [Polyangiaceae bacterium]
MFTRSLRLAVVALALTLPATLRPAAADAQEHSASDIAQGREFFNQGKQLRSKGDNVGALEKLKAAHALVGSPVTGIELAKTYVLLGQLVEGEEAFLSVARIPTRPEETAKSAVARRESASLAEQLRPRIPTLTIRITGVPPDSVAVTIDGTLVPKEALLGPRMVNPGSHRVLAKSTSGGTAETSVDLKEAEARDVELKLTFADGGETQSLAAAGPKEAAPPVAARAPEAEAEPHRRSHVLEWSLIGGGAAVAIGGAVLMGVEAGQTSNANDRHDRSAYDSALGLWRVGLVGTIVGGAAAVGGIVLFSISAGSDRAAATHSPLWIEAGATYARIGGTW